MGTIMRLSADMAQAGRTPARRSMPERPTLGNGLRGPVQSPISCRVSGEPAGPAWGRPAGPAGRGAGGHVLAAIVGAAALVVAIGLPILDQASSSRSAGLRGPDPVYGPGARLRLAATLACPSISEARDFYRSGRSDGDWQRMLPSIGPDRCNAVTGPVVVVGQAPANRMTAFRRAGGGPVLWAPTWRFLSPGRA